MAVNCHITASTHQGGNFTAGKLPTTTMKTIESRSCGGGALGGFTLYDKFRSAISSKLSLFVRTE